METSKNDLKRSFFINPECSKYWVGSSIVTLPEKRFQISNRHQNKRLRRKFVDGMESGEKLSDGSTSRRAKKPKFSKTAGPTFPYT